MLSKTQAHEVVVPWQHEAVAVEGAGGSVGTNEEPVDVEGGEATGEKNSPTDDELAKPPGWTLQNTPPSFQSFGLNKSKTHVSCCFRASSTGRLGSLVCRGTLHPIVQRLVHA